MFIIFSLILTVVGCCPIVTVNNNAVLTINVTNRSITSITVYDKNSNLIFGKNNLLVVYVQLSQVSDGVWTSSEPFDAEEARIVYTDGGQIICSANELNQAK